MKINKCELEDLLKKSPLYDPREINQDIIMEIAERNSIEIRDSVVARELNLLKCLKDFRLNLIYAVRAILLSASDMLSCLMSPLVPLMRRKQRKSLRKIYRKLREELNASCKSRSRKGNSTV